MLSDAVFRYVWIELGLRDILNLAYYGRCWSCSSAFEEFDGVTKNASGYTHRFLSHSFTLHCENVSKAFNHTDPFCLWF